MRYELFDEELYAALQACDELLRVSRAQQEAIADDMIDSLSELIDEGERLISSPSLAKAFSYASGPTPGRTASAHSQIVEKLNEVIRLDEANQTALQARLAEMKQQIITIRQGRRALGNYAHLAPAAEPVYLDRRR